MPFSGVLSMSESLDKPTKPVATRGGVPADTRVFAHVEKWMAVIREIKREPVTN
jgi:hypothetical protein